MAAGADDETLAAPALRATERSRGTELDEVHAVSVDLPVHSQPSRSVEPWEARRATGGATPLYTVFSALLI